MVETTAPSPTIYAQGFITPEGKRKVLILNKRDEPYTLKVSGAAKAELEYVDQTTGQEPPATIHSMGEQVTLKGFAVVVATLR